MLKWAYLTQFFSVSPRLLGVIFSNHPYSKYRVIYSTNLTTLEAGAPIRQKAMASSSSPSSSSVLSAFLCKNSNNTRISSFRSFTRPLSSSNVKRNFCLYHAKRSNRTRISAKHGEKSALQYRKVGDSDLEISEITLGTVSSCNSG